MTIVSVLTITPNGVAMRLMRTDFAIVTADLPLFEALQNAGETARDGDIVAVVENGVLVGLLDTTAAVEIASTRSRLGTMPDIPILAEVVHPSMNMPDSRP